MINMTCILGRCVEGGVEVLRLDPYRGSTVGVRLLLVVDG